MATYYVSAQNGNDANAGTSAALAWATIGKAIGEVAAGDTVYIGPGTYREKPSMSTSGTDGNPIRFIPDPEAQYLTDDISGIVRITGCDTNEIPTTGTVWTSASLSYINLGNPDKGFKQVYIDGAGPSDTQNGIFSHNNDHNNYYGVVAYGSQYGYFSTVSGSGNFKNSILVGGRYAAQGALSPKVIFDQCILLGGERGVNDCASISNSIVLASVWGNWRTPATNCIVIGASTGFYQSTFNGCIALFCGTGGFRGDSTNTTITNCLSVLCNRAVYGESTTDTLDVSGLKQVYCYNLRRGTTYESGDPTTSTAVLHDFYLIAEALKPLMQFAFNDGDNTVSIGDYDILGHLRRLGDGTIDIGPYEHSIMDTNFTEASPALEFTRAGMQKFVFWAEGGTLFTKKVSVKWSDYAGANKPQIIVDGDHVTRATTTATGDGTAYEEISVSATPDADGEVELFLYTRDTDAATKTYFKDLE